MFLCLLLTIWLSLVHPALFCLWLESVSPVILVVTDLFQVQLSLWFCDSGSCDPEILDLSKLLGVKLPLKSWNPGVTKLLRSCDPGHVKALGSPASSGCCGTGWRASVQGLLRVLAQTRRPMSLARLGFLCPWIPGAPVTLSIEADIMASSTMILSMLEHMGVELSLGVLGLVAELVLKLSSGHWLRP